MKLRWKHKVRGFTLSELMVTMVITVVVVGLAFAILNLVQKQMQAARQNYQGSTEINLLRQGLWHDLRTYPNTQWLSTDRRLELGFDKVAVSYQFGENQVIRNGDTLQVPVRGYSLFWKGKLVNNGAIDALELDVSKTETEQKLFVFRPATAADEIP